MSDTYTIWTLVAPPVFCSLLVGLFTHYLTKDRDVIARQAILDREADIRRRQFRSHLLRWRYILERTPTDAAAVFKRFSEFAPDLLAEAALVEGDFPNLGEFQRLVRQAGEWRENDAQAAAYKAGCDVRDILRDSICAVYNFTSPSKP